MNKYGMLMKVLNMKMKGKCPRGRLNSRWEHQVREDFLQKEGKVFQKIELWEDRDRWRDLVPRWPT
jgi:hypothetical protein